MVEEDYVMRMIKDLTKILAKLVLNKDVLMYELPIETEYSQIDIQHKQLIDLVKEGKINDAENLLYKELDNEDLKQFEMALSFYAYINEHDENFLEEHDYSREEIQEGIEVLIKEFGISYNTDIFGI